MKWWRFVIYSNSQGYDLGFYMINWNYPLKEKHWEIGIKFWKWSIGFELYK